MPSFPAFTSFVIMKTSVLIGLAFSAIGALAIASPAEGVAVAEAPTLVARQTARQCAARRRDFDECKRDEREEAQDLAECRRGKPLSFRLFSPLTLPNTHRQTRQPRKPSSTAAPIALTTALSSSASTTLANAKKAPSSAPTISATTKKIALSGISTTVVAVATRPASARKPRS